MKAVLKLTGVLSLAVICSPDVIGATYVVQAGHPQASDEGLGTEEKPFRSIGRAVKELKPGDVVLIKKGVYRESVTIEADGTEEKPITIQAFPGHEGRVIIKGSERFTDWKKLPGQPVWTSQWKYRLDGQYPEKWVDFGEYPKRCEMVFVDRKPLRQVLARGLLKLGTFFVDEAGQTLFIAVHYGTSLANVEVSVRQRGIFVHGNHLQIRGLTVIYVANHHKESAFEVRGRNIVIENCKALWNNLDGFRFAGRHLTVRKCAGSHNGRCGISASIHDSTIENYVTDENSWRFGPMRHAGGMKIVGGAPSNNRIIGHISRNNGKGIWFDYGCRNNRVERCFLHGNLIAGLEFEACLPENWVVNNIICHTRMARGSLVESITGTGVLLLESDSTRIYHNTIFGNERHAILIGGGLRIIRYTSEPALIARTQLYNNIFARNGYSAIGFWLWGKGAEEPVLTTHRFDYNLFWQPDSLIASYRDSKAETLEKWQKVFGQGKHSLSADPKFVGAEQCDFSLLPDSPAIGGGTPLKGVRTDFSGKRRLAGKRPTVGAFESNTEGEL